MTQPAFDNPFDDEDAPPAPARSGYTRTAAPSRQAKPVDAGADLHIISLQVENIKRIKAVRIEPDGSLVVIGGRNGQGKSSILDAIMYLFGGKGTIPGVPVRRGENGAIIEADLGELIVRREFDAAGKSTVRVTSPDGQQYGSPQAVLDALFSSAAFDPLAFAREKPKAQADRLREVLGLDFSELDRRRAKLYADRTASGQELKRSEGSLANMPHHRDAPAAEVSLAELSERLSEAKSLNIQNRNVRGRVEQIRGEIDTLNSEHAYILQQIEQLQRRAAEIDSRIQTKITEQVTAEASAAHLVDEDTGALEQAFRDAERTNQQVRANQQRALFAANVEALRAERDEYTAQIEAIDAEKARLITEAPFPVDGLGFSADGGVTLHGLPFEQASSAEQLRVSVGMGLAVSHRLPLLLIKDGSLLDPDSLRMVGELAAAKGAQVFVERVGAGEEVS
ncbi:MAG: AAA family ATPase, partial [Actinomycetota bacterium]